MVGTPSKLSPVVERDVVTGPVGVVGCDPKVRKDGDGRSAMTESGQESEEKKRALEPVACVGP